MAITKEEFVQFYNDRLHAAAIQVSRGSLVPMPCTCGEGGCQGWAMVANDTDSIYFTNIMLELHRYRERMKRLKEK